MAREGTENNTGATGQSNNTPFGWTIVVASVFIILANSLILLTLRLYNKRKVVDLLVLSLTLADFLNAIFPLQVLNIKANLIVGPWRNWLCDLFVWSTYTLRMASLSTVTLMSVEQALLLNQPLRYYTRMTVSFTRKLILFIWGMSAVASAAPKLLEITSKTNTMDSQCGYLPFQLGLEFGVFIEAVGVFQFGIVLTSYVVMVCSSKRFLQRQRSMIISQKRQERSAEDSTISEVGSVRREKIKEETQGMLQARQLCRVMGYVVVLYYSTWLPFLVYNLYSLLTRNTTYNNHIRVTVGTCSLATPILNPFLYVKMVSRYRKGVLFILNRVASICRGKGPLNDINGKRKRFFLEDYPSSTSSSLGLSWRRKDDMTGEIARTSTVTLVALDEVNATESKDDADSARGETVLRFCEGRDKMRNKCDKRRH